jgi:hypothetical protein
MNRHPKHMKIGSIISKAFGEQAIFDYKNGDAGKKIS